MFSRFTTKDGAALYIRTEDIRRLQDIPAMDGDPTECWVCWIEGGDQQGERIQGSADENMRRLLAEESGRAR